MTHIKNEIGLNGIEFVEFSSPEPRVLKELFKNFGFSRRMVHQEKNIELVISYKAKYWIAKNSFDQEYGARPLKRTIESNIKDKLADQLLLGQLKEGNVAFVDEENDSISLKIRDSAGTFH